MTINRKKFLKIVSGSILGTAILSIGLPKIFSNLHLKNRDNQKSANTAIDISNYHLKISGSVSNPLSLNFEDIKAIEPLVEDIKVSFPSTLGIGGYWKGIETRDLLIKAGIGEVSKVLFISADGSYVREESIDKVMDGGFLIAYQLNDKILSDKHGFPIRLVAKNEKGYKWTKWLGEIRVM